MQQDDRRSWTPKIHKKNWHIYRFLTLEKAPLKGVRDLGPVPSKSGSGLEETPRYLGGRLHTHTGHGTSQLVAINVLGPGQ